MRYIRILFLVLLVLAVCAIPVLAVEPVEGPPIFDDGRINNFDLVAPVAVFGIDYEGARGMDFWAPVGYDGAGKMVLRVLPDQIAAVEQFPDEPALIAASDMIDLKLYRMPDGSFEVWVLCNCVEYYVLNFDEIAANVGYDSQWVKPAQ